MNLNFNTEQKKKIKKFLNEIKYNQSFFNDMADWEYDFLFSSAKTYGISAVNLARFILDYRENSAAKKKKLEVTQ